MKSNKLQNIVKCVDKHIPDVLMAMSVAGVFVTAFLVADGTVKALEHIQDAKDEKFEATGDDKLTTKETIAACAKDFTPAGVAGLLTISCGVGAYSEKVREAGMYAVGYEGVVRALHDERGLSSKLKEALGPKKTQIAEEEYVNEKAQTLEEKPREALPIIGKGTHVFKDTVQQREFISDYETVRAAFNTFNEQIIDDPFTSGVSWNNLNECLGLDDSPSCDMWIYTVDDLPIKPVIGSTLDSMGNPCFSLGYKMPTTLA